MLVLEDHNTSAASLSGRSAAGLKAEIEMLGAEIAALEARISSYQTEFRATHERDQAEQHLAGLLRMTADLMSARERAARLGGELSALRSLRGARPWWWRMLVG
jgi:hypothetical protein